MAKKTWIKVKRGILEPKHRRGLGEAWYLYLYMLDLTNWENGVIYDWKDKDVAVDLEIPLATLRDHRRKLEDALYIKTTIKRYGLQIAITNWTNPREYSGEVYNEIQGYETSSPSNSQGDTQSDTESDTQSAEILTPLHLTHINTYHSTHVNSKNIFSELGDILKIPFTNSKEADYLQTLVEDYGEEKVKKVARWLAEKDPNGNSMWKALRAIDTAARTWSEKPEKKSIEQIIMEA